MLCSPQMGENIGATARVMNNFGFSALRIVSPRDGWPNSKAFSMATAHAEQILESAKVFENVSEAVADCKIVFATTGRVRELVKNIYNSNQLNSAQNLKTNENIAILFGREKFGLTNEELLLANHIVTIPTFGENFSLNIAQAVAIIAYEFALLFNNDKIENQSDLDLAPKEELSSFFNYLLPLLESRDFFKAKDKEEIMQHRIQNLFNKAEFSSQELRTIWGIIRALEK